MIAPIIVDEVLRDMRKDSANLKLERMIRPGQLDERSATNRPACCRLCLCLWKIGSSYGQAATYNCQCEENSARSTVRTVVSKKDIGLYMTRLIASFQDVRRKKDSATENLRYVLSWRRRIRKTK